MKKVFILLITIILLNSCFNPETVYHEPKSMRDLNRGEIVIVGRVLIDPPLTPREQNFRIDGIDILGSEDAFERNNRQGINLTLDNELPAEQEKVKKHAKLLDFYSKKIFRIKDHKFFYLKYTRDPLYIVNGKILLQYIYGKPADNRWMQGQSLVTYGEKVKYILFPINGYINIKSNEEAVYVGTIKVKRDNDNKILSVELIDEYDKAVQDFKVNFGDRPLGKSLMTLIKK